MFKRDLGVLIFQWPGCFDLSVNCYQCQHPSKLLSNIWVFWSFSDLGVLIFQWTVINVSIQASYCPIPGCFDLSVTWVFWSFSDLINVSIQASECPMEPNMQSGSLTKSDRCRCAQYHKVQRLVCAGATRGAFISWSWCVLAWLKVALGPARPPAQVVWSSGNVSQARQSHQKVFKPGRSHAT